VVVAPHAAAIAISWPTLIWLNRHFLRRIIYKARFERRIGMALGRKRWCGRMIEVDKDAFAAIESAIAACAKTLTTTRGLKLMMANKQWSVDELRSAACVALMSLTREFVRPNDMQFLGFNDTLTKDERYAS
jgi:hypothetical protein